MQWIPFIILVYVTVLVQATLVGVLVLPLGWTGPVAPDLAAAVAVFIALNARSGLDVMIAAWIMGMAMDLMLCGGGGAPTAVGPMAIAYALSAGLLFHVREAFFHERAMTQALLALLFCLLAHGAWITAQTLLGAPWSAYGQWLAKGAGISVYTAVLAPLVCAALRTPRRWFLAVPTDRRRGRR